MCALNLSACAHVVPLCCLCGLPHQQQSVAAGHVGVCHMWHYVSWLLPPPFKLQLICARKCDFRNNQRGGEVGAVKKLHYYRQSSLLCAAAKYAHVWLWRLEICLHICTLSQTFYCICRQSGDLISFASFFSCGKP